MTVMCNPCHPGEVIRESVKARGWTVTETAARLGVARQALSRLLNGKVGISPATPGAGARTSRLEQCRLLDEDASGVRPGTGETPPRGGVTATEDAWAPDSTGFAGLSARIPGVRLACPPFLVGTRWRSKSK